MGEMVARRIVIPSIDQAFSPYFSVLLLTQAAGLGWDDFAPLALGQLGRSRISYPCPWNDFAPLALGGRAG